MRRCTLPSQQPRPGAHLRPLVVPPRAAPLFSAPPSHRHPRMHSIPPSALARRTQGLELGIVLLVLVVPVAYAILCGTTRQSSTVEEWVHDAILDLGSIALVAYLLVRDRGSLRAIGVRAM